MAGDSLSRAKLYQNLFNLPAELEPTPEYSSQSSSNYLPMFNFSHAFSEDLMQ